MSSEFWRQSKENKIPSKQAGQRMGGRETGDIGGKRCALLKDVEQGMTYDGRRY